MAQEHFGNRKSCCSDAKRLLGTAALIRYVTGQGVFRQATCKTQSLPEARDIGKEVGHLTPAFIQGPAGHNSLRGQDALFMVLLMIKGAQMQLSCADSMIRYLQPISTANALKSNSNSFCKGSKWLQQTPTPSICWSVPAVQGEVSVTSSFPRASLLA